MNTHNPQRASAAFDNTRLPDITFRLTDGDEDGLDVDIQLPPPAVTFQQGDNYWVRSQVLEMRRADLQALREAESHAEYWRQRCIREAQRKPAPAEPVLRLQGKFVCIGLVGDALQLRDHDETPGLLLQRDDGSSLMVLGMTEAECRDAAGGFLERCSLVLHAEGAL